MREHLTDCGGFGEFVFAINPAGYGPKRIDLLVFRRKNARREGHGHQFIIKPEFFCCPHTAK